MMLGWMDEFQVKKERNAGKLLINQHNYDRKTYDENTGKWNYFFKNVPVHFIFNNPSSTLSVHIVAHAENLKSWV